MIKVSELRDWLAGFDPSDQVGIDEGGLTLVAIGEPGTYLEVGGVVDPDACGACGEPLGSSDEGGVRWCQNGHGYAKEER